VAVDLKPLPATFTQTRDALHRVAEELVAPARKPHNEIALRQTPGGFGTPEFEFEGETTQVRVVGAELVLMRGREEELVALRSLAAGGALLGPGLLPDGVPDDESPLEVDADGAARLADLYAFAAVVLERVASELPPDAEPSETTLWPEHFDIAFEAGAEDAGRRATFGVSPGDDDHGEPYAYVGPWDPGVSGELWNARGFRGAELGYAELLAAEDAESEAVEFMRSRYAALAGAG
jgi:hypothetical protein